MQRMRGVPSERLPSARGSGEDPIGGDKTTCSSIHRKNCMKIGMGGGGVPLYCYH